VTNTTAGTGSLGSFGKASNGNTIVLVPSSATTGAYCIFASNPGASTATGGTPDVEMWYSSQGGGLQANTQTGQACA
jgi:hypothetical protein